MSIYKLLTRKYLRYHRRRTWYTILGIVLSVALITSMGTFFMSLQQESRFQTEQEIGLYHYMVKNSTPDMLEKLRANPSIQEIGLMQTEQVHLVNGEHMLLHHMDPVAHQLLPFRHITGNGLIVNKMLPYHLGSPVQPGDIITLKGSEQEYQLPVTRVITDDDHQLFDRDTISAYRTVDHVNGQNATVYFKLVQGANFERMEDFLLQLTDASNIISNRVLLQAMPSYYLNPVHFYQLFYVSFPVYIVVLMIFAFIYNTFQMSVAERTRHIGLLRSLGATKQQVRQMIFYEIQLVSLVGIPIGLLLGVYGLRFVAFIYQLCFESGSFSILHINFTFSPWVILMSTVISGIAIYCAAWLPARQAVHIAPMKGMRSVEHGVKRKRSTPNIKSRLFARVFGIDNMLALRSMRMNRKRFYMNIFTLTLSVFLFTMFTFVSSAFIQGDMGSPKQAADFTVRNVLHSSRFISDVTEALDGIKGVETTYVKDIDQSINLLPQPVVKESDPSYKEMHFDGGPGGYRAKISLFRDENIPYYAAHVLEGEVQDIHEDAAYVIAVVGSRESHPRIKAGEEAYLSVQQDMNSLRSSPRSDILKIKIAAVVRGNTSGNLPSIIVQPEMYQQIMSQKGDLPVPVAMDIYLQDTEQEHAIYQTLQQKLESRYGYVVDSKVNDERNYSLGSLQISIMLYGFVVAIAIIASLNMMNTLVMNLWMRQKEFSLLRAIGLSQRRLRSMIVKEGLFYGVISGSIGGLSSFAVLALLYTRTGRVMDLWMWIMILAPFCIVAGIGYAAARIALGSMKAKRNFQGRVYD